ncbi:MAG: SDR family NAD(P)-dependent oxidoreductase [Rhodovibrionaceae bacterium]|nr:SDR family NAD(P)-dependent oxidoreductase [Rhodovibrionaceae bacterium]
MLPSEGRVVMVSGANRGIGRAIAAKLQHAGYDLSLGARDPATLDGVATGGGQVLRHAYEASSAESAEEWVAATRHRFGRIDALVNVAGIMQPVSVEDGDEAALDAMWDVNVKGPYRLMHAAFDDLKEAGSGRIVTVVSLSGKRVKSADVGGYAMSKFAALALSHAARYAGWEHGIRCCAICPGYVRTDMTAKVEAVDGADMIQPEDLAEIVATVLALPNTASVSEVPINCILEHSF